MSSANSIAYQPMPEPHHSAGQTLLLTCLKTPEIVSTLTLTQWSLLLRMAKTCKLVAHLAWLLEQKQLIHAVPEKIKQHFQAAQTIIDYRQRMALWELNRLQRVLIECNSDIIVLKGCAYLLADLPFAKARIFADVDIMVDKAVIDDIEMILLTHNWQSLKLNEYDQSYYRLWMHEIPPLRHTARNMEVDVHHTIIPPTSRLHPEPNLLFQEAIASQHLRFKILSPCDMVLHSAVHLFFDSELGNRLKDLVDLDQLLRHFDQQDSDFFRALLQRAEVLGLQRPLYYALRYTHQLLNTPMPNNIAEDSAKIAPNALIQGLMDYLVPLALLPEHPDDASRKVGLARWLLFVRSHYLRMPLTLLLPHLARKSLMRIIPKEEADI